MILFADDMCLLAPTRSTLSRLISYCADFCSKHGLSFNTKKSKVMVFSNKNVNLDDLKPVYLDGKAIDYVTSIRYLGTTVASSPGLIFSARDDLLNFYRSANSILNAVQKTKDEVLIHLLYTNCVPTLTYACSVKEYPPREMQECHVALNDAIRKIFTYNRWESIKHLRNGFGYNSLSLIFASARKNFHHSLATHHNSVIRHIFYATNID